MLSDHSGGVSLVKMRGSISPGLGVPLLHRDKVPQELTEANVAWSLPLVSVREKGDVLYIIDTCN